MHDAVLRILENGSVSADNPAAYLQRSTSNGLIDRHRHPSSGREIVVELTRRGRAVVDTVSARRRAEIARIVAGRPYKTKSELSRNRLYTALTAAIRSYEQIHTINASRRGLGMVIRASSQLLARQGVSEFAAGIITQICGLFGLPPEGVGPPDYVSRDEG